MGATTRRGRRERGRGRRIARRRWTSSRGDRNVPRADRPAETARVSRGARASAGAATPPGARGARASEQDAHAIAHPRTRECWLVRVIASRCYENRPRQLAVRLITRTTTPNAPSPDGLVVIPLAPPSRNPRSPRLRRAATRVRHAHARARAHFRARRASHPGSDAPPRRARARARLLLLLLLLRRPCSITSRSRWRRARASTCTTSRPRSSRS